MGAADHPRPLRQLPSVDDVLRSEGARALLGRYPRWAVVDAARAEIAERRARLQRGAPADEPGAVPSADPVAAVSQRLAGRVQALVEPHLRRALNATGVVLHTNL